MTKVPLLIVEDNALLGQAIRETLEAEGFDVVHAETGKEAEKILKEREFPVALVDLMLPDTNGKDLLTKWRSCHPDMLVVIMTAYGDTHRAVECIKLGAHDFLDKPVEKVLLATTMKNATEQQKLSRRMVVLEELEARKSKAQGLGEIVGNSDAIGNVTQLIQRVAANQFSCLFLRGESGTGKGVFAKTIHQVGKRSDKPFVEVNCSALPPSLIESELFGHRKGAFTDAKEDRSGLFELADGGTLFLDEIGDMEINLQSKLLKVIEDQEFRRLGDSKIRKVSVAIIAATHQNVEELVAQGKFREDLYYRLNVIPLVIPPLRDHKSDIPVLCEHFISVYQVRVGSPARRFSDDVIKQFMEYSWPGNVRELRNLVERGCLLAHEEQISTEDLLLPESGLTESSSHA
jgi:DNA-binding NtrC family response regulator